MSSLTLPIRNIRRSLDVVEMSNWTSEAVEAFQKIKRRLGKLQTLGVSKEGETLMICLQPRSKTISFVILSKGTSVGTNQHNKIPKKDLQDIQGQRGDKQPHGRDVKSFRDHRMIAYMGSRIENIQYFIHSKEGSKRENSEKNQARRAGTASASLYASEDDMDYEALLDGLVAFAERGNEGSTCVCRIKTFSRSGGRKRNPKNGRSKEVHGRDHGCHNSIL
ncbi:hypothetical protein Tco_1302197 [Tanacetum coccineum]